MKKIIIVFCLIAFACDTTSEVDKDDAQILDLAEFTMAIPHGWKYTPMRGVDSFVGVIEINSQEKISIDYGPYGNNLNVESNTHHIDFKLVSGKGAKIVRPKVSGQGFTGLYIENVKGGSSQTRFTMSGLNLSPQTEQALLKVFKTVRFD